VGSLMGSLVGQTEERTRRALQIADAMAPCVLMCDEIEKALSGVAGSGQTDSGVSARMFGSLLTWLNDHTSDVFFVATCNDISNLPPEFSRAERFDGVFFVDLPSAKQRRTIWQIYLGMFDIDPDQELPSDEGWTGQLKTWPCASSRFFRFLLRHGGSFEGAADGNALRLEGRAKVFATPMPDLFDRHCFQRPPDHFATGFSQQSGVAQN